MKVLESARSVGLSVDREDSEMPFSGDLSLLSPSPYEPLLSPTFLRWLSRVFRILPKMWLRRLCQ